MKPGVIYFPAASITSSFSFGEILKSTSVIFVFSIRISNFSKSFVQVVNKYPFLISISATSKYNIFHSYIWDIWDLLITNHYSRRHKYKLHNKQDAKQRSNKFIPFVNRHSHQTTTKSAGSRPEYICEAVSQLVCQYGN